MSSMGVAPASEVSVNVTAPTTEEDIAQPDPVKAAPTPTVCHDAIATRAYELFLARGAEHGCDWEDWFRAESELLGEARRAD
ncbi:MAG: DUF2934 domain-containing protein [candidate division NC10 bacterium]|nr:DUF2934 domain-containing protein [candidate division NC10 bacterium]